MVLGGQFAASAALNGAFMIRISEIASNVLPRGMVFARTMPKTKRHALGAERDPRDSRLTLR